jgi:predicted CoA-binding protein
LQTQALSAFVAKALAGKGPHTVILVTPRVNIRKFVGENVGSAGDMVSVRADQDGRYINRCLISSPGGHHPVSP